MNIMKLLKDAPQLDVHKWSDYPEVNNVVDAIFNEIKVLRKSRKKRIRGEDKVKRSLKVAIIDLWAAHKLSFNPFRAISKNKTNYQKGDRYRKIHLKFDYLIPVINDLRDLGYIEEKLGYKFEIDAKRTRIRATEKLINKILQPEYGLKDIVDNEGAASFVTRDGSSEIIRFKNAKKEYIDYEDTELTNQMRANLELINKQIRGTRITLD